MWKAKRLALVFVSSSLGKEAKLVCFISTSFALQDNAVDEKATEEKKKPWFRSLVDGLGDEKKKSLFGIFKDKVSSNPGPEVKPSSKLGSNDNHHDIKKGDTLWAISGKYGVSPNMFLFMNFF